MSYIYFNEKLQTPVTYTRKPGKQSRTSLYHLQNRTTIITTVYIYNNFKMIFILK